MRGHKRARAMFPSVQAAIDEFDALDMIVQPCSSRGRRGGRSQRQGRRRRQGRPARPGRLPRAGPRWRSEAATTATAGPSPMYVL